jgi:cell division protease FtsH
MGAVNKLLLIPSRNMKKHPWTYGRWAFIITIGHYVNLKVMHMRKKRLKIALLIALLVVAIAISAYIHNENKQNVIDYSYIQFLELAEHGKVEMVNLGQGPNITGNLIDGTRFSTQNPRSEDFKEKMLMMGIKVEERQQKDSIISAANGLVVFAILISAVWLISRYMNKNQAATNKDSAGDLTSMECETIENVGLGFDDIAGNLEAKESVMDIVDFLSNPDKYVRMGARMPRGVIFHGSPGTGKTMLAKAVAGEAGVPFFAFSGSDFVQVYVGVGAARVRDVFRKAREKGKCVIFIDEIDALGKKRDGLSGGNDERSQTLNALLTEMSGFNANDGIVVIAATNRLDVLDEALLRPGRFDRQVEIGLPDVNERAEILKIHSRNKPLAADVDLNRLAHQTVYFSGAELENLLNEGAIIAARRGSRIIEKQDIEQAFYTVVAGAEKKDRSAISKADREITAYHEAGHALVTKLIAPGNRVTKVTIIPSTKGAGGFSISLPPDRMYRSRKEMENNIKIALAGRIAEEIIFGNDNVTTGASNDIEKATQMVMALVKRFGMGQNTGLLNYDILLKNGQGSNQEILDECKSAMNEYYKEVKELIVSNKYILDRIARTLLEEESIDEESLDMIMNGTHQPAPAVSAGQSHDSAGRVRSAATA